MKDITYAELCQLQQDESEAEMPIDAVYVHSPICGTCRLGEDMLRIVEQAIPTLRLARLDLNTSPEAASYYQIRSIPCLLVWKPSDSYPRIPEQHYALRSVTHLFMILGGGQVND